MRLIGRMNAHKRWHLPTVDKPIQLMRFSTNGVKQETARNNQI
jgi:hypothetical protein